MSGPTGTLPPPAPEPALQLRPLSFGELLDKIFRIYRRHFWLLVTLALILALPQLLAQVFGGQADQLAYSATLLTNLGNPSSSLMVPPPLNLGWYVFFYFLLILMVPFVAGAITLAAIDLALGDRVTLGTCLAGVLRRYMALLGTVLLYAALVPTLVCFPVTIWIFVRWSLAVPALLAERVGPIRAVRRSWELTRQHWWRLFGILLVVYVISSVGASILGAFALPIAILVPFVSGTVRGATALTASTVGSALLTPLQYLCVVLLYFDLRIRKESFDLDQLARQAGRAAAG